MTFEEILASSMDEDGDCLWFKDKSLKSTLNPVDLGLVLTGQPISILADLTTEFEEATKHTKMEIRTD